MISQKENILRKTIKIPRRNKGLWGTGKLQHQSVYSTVIFIPLHNFVPFTLLSIILGWVCEHIQRLSEVHEMLCKPTSIASAQVLPTIAGSEP